MGRALDLITRRRLDWCGSTFGFSLGAVNMFSIEIISGKRRHFCALQLKAIVFKKLRSEYFFSKSNFSELREVNQPPFFFSFPLISFSSTFPFSSSSTVTSQTVDALCEEETVGGGWLLFQKNRPRANDRHENPFANSRWQDYRDGFGDPSSSAFWLGLETLHRVILMLVWEVIPLHL